MPFLSFDNSSPPSFPQTSAQLSFTSDGVPTINSSVLTPSPSDHFDAGTYWIIRTQDSISFVSKPLSPGPSAPSVVLRLDQAGYNNLNQWAQTHHRSITFHGFTDTNSTTLLLSIPCDAANNNQHTITKDGKLLQHARDSISFLPSDHLQLFLGERSVNHYFDAAKRSCNPGTPTYVKPTTDGTPQLHAALHTATLQCLPSARR